MFCDQVTIRIARKNDLAEILGVVGRAFAGDTEQKLVETLATSRTGTLSLVAACDGRIIGHILFSAIEAPLAAMALAPLAVDPDYRELQIGTKLVHAALERLRKRGIEAVFVLGDRTYYERFGFSSAAADPFDAPWQSPHFMALELVEGALKDKAGALTYPPVFTA